MGHDSCRPTFLPVPLILATDHVSLESKYLMHFWLRLAYHSLPATLNLSFVLNFEVIDDLLAQEVKVLMVLCKSTIILGIFNMDLAEMVKTSMAAVLCASPKPDVYTPIKTDFHSLIVEVSTLGSP